MASFCIYSKIQKKSIDNSVIFFANYVIFRENLASYESFFIVVYLLD